MFFSIKPLNNIALDMEFKKLLITGCSGFLGWNISTINSDKFFITGIYNSSFIRIPNIKCVKCDLTDFQCLKEIFYSFEPDADRKSTRLNSSHVRISYAVFCLKKKKTN